VGWLIAGASQQAAPRFIETLRRMTPLPDGSVAAYAAAIHSRSPFRAHSFATQHQIPFQSAELDALLARPQIRAVYVANHPARHAETVLAALRAGKHVLCEPPLALSVEQAHFLHLSAADRGLTLAVHYQQHFDPALNTLRTLLAEGELGDLLALHLHQLTPLPVQQRTWRVAADGGGLLFERALRTIDLARLLSGDEVRTLMAQAGPSAYGAGVVDELHALLTLRKSGAVVHLHDSWNAGATPSRIELYATAGSATVVDWNGERTSRLFVARSGPRARSAQAAEDGALPVPLPNVDLWQLSLLSVHEAIRTGNPPALSPVHDIAALDVARTIEAALRSGASGRPALADPPAGAGLLPTSLDDLPTSRD
jgi:1,5-anhydro-D-fructose reductase (1,5-anhydro-D-mannitol-forming)